MQKPCEHKRRAITATAARLFAERLYHEVRLDEVAATAGVGKGTLYVYFEGKEQLYEAILAEGFGALIDDVQRRLEATSGAVWARLEAIVDELLEFSRRYPHVFALMRSRQPAASNLEMTRLRDRLATHVEAVLREGLASGELDDPHPELTAHFVSAMVRAALLYGDPATPLDEVREHILRLLRTGLGSLPRSAPSPHE